MVKEIHNEKQFNDAVKKDIAIIDFWAEWCMPCIALAPVFESLSEKFKNITFAKVNVDDNAGLAEKFDIDAIPCLLVFRKGRLVDRIIGARGKEELEKQLKKLLP